MTKDMTSRASSVRLKKLIMSAMFVAVAYVARFVFHFNAMFLTFEFKDAIIDEHPFYDSPIT